MFSALRYTPKSIWRQFKARVQSRIIATLVPTWPSDARPDYFDRTFENFVKEGYSKNEIIYACINATANTAASVVLRVYRSDSGAHEVGAGEELRDHPLTQLLKKPNPMMGQYDFWTSTIIDEMLAGVAYWQKIRNGTGQIISLWPIRPDYVRPVVEGGKGLVGYRVIINGVELETLPATDVIAFRFPDPLHLFDRQSPVEVLARSADVDNSLTDLIKMVLQKGGMPLGVLTSKLRLDDNAIADIRRRWSERYGGYSNWMEPAVLDSDATYQRMGMTPAEMNFEILDGRCETRICMVLRVPPIIIGATAGLARSTFSNYESARKQWWEDTLSAYYKHLSDAMQIQMAELDFGDDIELRWDFTKVPALQEERDGRWTRAISAATAGVITVNMALVEMGLPTVGKEGDVFLRSTMVTAVPSNAADETGEADVSTVVDGTNDDDQLDNSGSTATTDNPPPSVQGKQPEPISTKSLTIGSAESAVPVTIKPIGKPLSKDAALTVAPVADHEVNSWFETYAGLKAKASKDDQPAKEPATNGKTNGNGAAYA